MPDSLQDFLFSLQHAPEMEPLRERFQELVCSPGEVLIHEGQPADSFFLIAEGEAEVLKSMNTDNERFMGLRLAGDFLGETALLTPEIPRTASVRARTHLRLLKLTQQDFDLLLPRHPNLALVLARHLAHRLRDDDNATILDLQKKNDELARAYAELQAAQAQLVEKERLEKELQVAQDIQRSILPAHLPSLPGVEFAAIMVPARAVGGDLYDVIVLEGGQVGLFIGDVSDKGVPAAIFMALVRSLVRAEACWSCLPDEVLQNVNRHLLDMNEASLFVTVLYGIYDPATRQFNYARGGHELPLLYAPNGTALHPDNEQGMLLGIFPNPVLDLQKLTIPTGGTLVLYTDGAMDAINASGERFGKERLVAAVEANLGRSAQEICDEVLHSIHTFLGGAPQADDITLLVLHSAPG